VVTPGNETDFDEIEVDMRQLCSRFNVVSVGYDPWQSAQMSQRLRAEGVPMHEFRATTQNFSPAIIELDAAMRSGRLRHEGNPVLERCLGNVVGKADRRGNLYPTKRRPEQKIDAAVALMMAMGRAMIGDEEAKGPRVWKASSPIRSSANSDRRRRACSTLGTAIGPAFIEREILDLAGQVDRRYRL